MVKREKKGLPWIIPAGLAVLFTSAVFTGQLAAGWISARLPLVPPGAPLVLPERAYQDEVTAQEWSAFAGLLSSGVNLVTLLVSIITLIVLALTLLTTQRMLEAARDTVSETRQIGRAQTRCYLTLGRFRWSYNWPDGIPNASIEFRNSGNSPAISPEITIRVETSSTLKDLSKGPDQEFWDLQDLSNIQANSPDVQLQLAFSGWTNPESLALPLTGIEKVYFYIEVALTCEDVFGDLHTDLRAYMTVNEVGGAVRTERLFPIPILGRRVHEIAMQHRERTLRYSTAARR